jgi:hypothetical protein
VYYSEGRTAGAGIEKRLIPRNFLGPLGANSSKIERSAAFGAGDRIDPGKWHGVRVRGIRRTVEFQVLATLALYVEYLDPIYAEPGMR